MKEALTLLLLTATSFAQTRSSQLEMFKSPDGTFLFHYPKSLVFCQPQYQKPGNPPDETSILTRWSPDSCDRMLPICPGTALPVTAHGPLHPEPVVCTAYPESAYKGTNFDGAALSLSIVPGRVEKDCFEDRLGTQKTHWGKIAGERAKISENGEGGLSHGLSSDVYQIFHHARCNDIEIRLTQTSPGAYDAGAIKIMSNSEEERIREKLLSILNSFRFLN